MSENTFNVVIDYQFSRENDRIARDLAECHKKIEFLESYRKFLIKFSEECVCRQSSIIRSMVKSLEKEYQNIFPSNEDNQQTIEQNSDQHCSVIEELIQTTEESNDRNTTNQRTEDTVQQIDNKSNDNIVLVYNKTNNSIVKKRRDNIDSNVEIIINKFVLKKTEESVTKEVAGNSTQPSKEMAAKKTISSPEVVKTTTKPLIYENSKHSESLSSGKALLVLSPHKRKCPTAQTSPETKKRLKSNKRNILSENSNNGQNLTEKYKENNRVFTSLLNDLKKGIIDSFFDKNYNLIKGMTELKPKTFKLKNSPLVSLQNKKVVFNCTHEGCQFVSENTHSARRHAQRHTKTKAFVCNTCNKSFTLKPYLQQHMKVVHNIKGKPFMRCEFPGCEYRSITKSQLKNHYIKHTEEKTIKCEHNGCDAYFKTISMMRSHMKIHAEVKEFACDWTGCEARFKSKTYLKRHMETHTGKGVSISRLKDVLQSGNYSSTIEKNNYLFSVIRQQSINQSNGKVEIGAQLGFKCNHIGCQFASIFKHLMRQHVSTHSLGKHFECNLCNKRFGLAKYLTQHKKTVHNINNSPIICCPVPECQYKTTYSLGLRIHSLTHQTERPFKCDYNGCDKRFKTQVLLRWHKNNRHLKVKPFVCDYVGCQSSFDVREQLKRHIKCHNKPFRCHFDNCSKSYKKKRDLNYHISEKH